MLKVEIQVKGRIDKEWSEWLGGLAIDHTAEDDTVLTGWLPDQAALYGLIAQLRNLGLPLVFVNSEEQEQADL
jgi:hypothetical protein